MSELITATAPRLRIRREDFHGTAECFVWAAQAYLHAAKLAALDRAPIRLRRTLRQHMRSDARTALRQARRAAAERQAREERAK